MCAQVIMQDMASFLVVICVIMLGSTFFFIVNSPSSALFGYHDVFGPLRPRNEKTQSGPYKKALFYLGVLSQKIPKTRFICFCMK